MGRKGESQSNLIGQRFGRLTVVADEGMHGRRHFWRCRCDCGTENVIASQDHLKSGKKKSCGCLHDCVYQENLKLVAGTSVTKLETRRGKLNSSNTSGYNGVYRHNSHGYKTQQWTAQIGFCGKKYNLGTFDNLEDAVEARREAERQMYDGFLNWYYDRYTADGETEVKVNGSTGPESETGQEV